MAPDGRLSGRAGLVQPTRPWRGLASDREDRRAARRRHLWIKTRESRTVRAIAASRARPPIPSGAASWTLRRATGSRSNQWSWRSWRTRPCSEGMEGAPALIRWGGRAGRVYSRFDILHFSGFRKAGGAVASQHAQMLTLKSLRTRRTNDSTSVEAIPRRADRWRRNSFQTRPRATATQRVTVDWFTRYIEAMRAWLAPPTRFNRQTTRSRQTAPPAPPRAPPRTRAGSAP